MDIRSRKKTGSGFTLLEILTVVGIIGVLSAFAAPPIYSYLRQYRIRGAVQEVIGNINNARNRAIMKSANFGVLFVVGHSDSAQNATTYWIHMDDYQRSDAGASSGEQQELDFGDPQPAQSLRFRLPGSVVFATAAQCNALPAPVPAFAPNAYALRFSRLGGACQPGAGTCRAPRVASAPAASLIHNDNATGETTICLQDRSSVGAGSDPCPTCPSRWVRVSLGGRVVEGEEWIKAHQP